MRHLLISSLAVYILDLWGVLIFFIFVLNAQLIVSGDSLRVELMRMISDELRESYLVFIVIIENTLNQISSSVKEMKILKLIMENKQSKAVKE